MNAPEITAGTVRTDALKLRAAQVFAPVSMVVSVLARRTMSPLLIAAAAGLFAATFIAFARARRSLGRATLHADAGRLRIGDGVAKIARGDVRAWTIEGGLARVYVANAGWHPPRAH